MSVTVVKGQKVDLTKGNPGLNSLVVEIGWQSPSSFEIDTSAFLLGAQGKVSKDEDLIFYNNPSTPYIRYKEAGTSNSLKRFEVELNKAPTDVMKLAFTLTIYDGEKRGQSFRQVNQAYFRILNQQTGAELLRCDLENQFSVETAIVVGELYRYSGEWKFSAIAAGFAGGLKELCRNFGIEANEEPPPSPSESSPPINLNLKKIELKNGSKGVVQALGNAFGSLQKPPYVMLDGDDRTGTVTTGEDLRINGNKIAEIERILIFSFIYQGVTNWSEADGVVTINHGDSDGLPVLNNRFSGGAIVNGLVC